MALGRQRSVHYTKVLTNYAVDYAPKQLVGRELFPVINVENHADVWPVFDKSQFDDVNDLRSDGDEANEVSRGWKYEPYLCETRALREPITEKQRRNWDSEVDFEADTTEYLKQLIWNRYEVRLFGTNGFVRKAANNAGSANVDWTNLSTASVKAALDTGMETCESAAGRTPNVIVLTPQVGRHIRNTAEWKDYYKYTSNISDVDLPETIYGLKAYYVESLINTARKGQAPSLTRIMGDDVWIGYVGPWGYKQLTYGATLMTYEEAGTWYDNGRKADIYEYEAEFVQVLIAKECGYLLTSVLTA